MDSLIILQECKKGKTNTYILHKRQMTNINDTPTPQVAKPKYLDLDQHINQVIVNNFKGNVFECDELVIMIIIKTLQ